MNSNSRAALEAIWGLLSAVDRFIVQQAPWKLAKDPASKDALDPTLYTAAEALRIATALLAPVMPDSTAKIWSQLGMPDPLESVRLDALTWGQLQAGQRIGEIAAVFPAHRRERKPSRKCACSKARSPRNRPRSWESRLRPPSRRRPPPNVYIGIDDFAKVELRVGLVLSAEPVKGADKLLHLKVDIGEPEPRTIVAGIAEAYRPEQIIGRKVVIVANLAPRGNCAASCRTG